MDHPYFQLSPIEVQPLTVHNFRPYGWLLGKATPPESGSVAFSNAETTFQEEHIFDSGVGGELQILWVIYRNQQREVPSEVFDLKPTSERFRDSVESRNGEHS